MWHRLPYEQKRRPSGYAAYVSDAQPAEDWIDVPEGVRHPRVDRGTLAFGWDNEFGACRANVPSFAMERHNVTNGRFL